MVGRYDAKGPEAESEPGSRGRVLRNRVGITSVREIERRESEALLAETQATIDETRIDQRFTAEDIRRMHRRWLGEIYAWAGDYRQVNIAKGGVHVRGGRSGAQAHAGIRAPAIARLHAL